MTCPKCFPHPCACTMDESELLDEVLRLRAGMRNPVTETVAVRHACGHEVECLMVLDETPIEEVAEGMAALPCIRCRDLAEMDG